MRRAVFLDRDGVLNRAIVREGRPFPPSSLGEFKLLPGVVEACGLLRSAGFKLIVVTNQPDVARGTTQREFVETIHSRLRDQMPLDDIRACYHDDADACECRKPLPGLLLGAARDWQIDLAASFMVGDRWRDVEAGHRAGCRTILIDHGYDEMQRVSPDRLVDSLLDAARFILAEDAHWIGAER